MMACSAVGGLCTCSLVVEGGKSLGVEVAAGESGGVGVVLDGLL